MKKLCCWPTLHIKVKVSYLNWQVKQTASDQMLPALKITIENHSCLCQANTLCSASSWLLLRWQKGRVGAFCANSYIWRASRAPASGRGGGRCAVSIGTTRRQVHLSRFRLQVALKAETVCLPKEEKYRVLLLFVTGVSILYFLMNTELNWEATLIN